MAARQPKPPVGTLVRKARVAAYRAAILDAAEQVFADAGFESAKMEDIARVAGVAKGTVYNYFQSKEAVFGALADRGRVELLGIIDDAMASATVDDRPRAFVHGLMQFIERGARMAIVYMHATGLSLRSELDPHAAEGRKMLTDRLVDSIRPLYESGRLRTDLPLERLAVLLGGLVGVTIQDFLERGEQSGLTEAADSIMTLFFDGAKAR